MSQIQSPDRGRSLSPGELVRLLPNRSVPQGACRVRYVAPQGVVIDLPDQDGLVRFEDIEAVLPTPRLQEKPRPILAGLAPGGPS
jgi:hypothetical protein